MSTKRLFFALWPDNRQRERLRDVISSVAKVVEGSAVDRRLWHVTLPFIGDFEESRIPELQNLAGRIQVEPFRLGFDRLEYWVRPKVACLVPSTVPVELGSLVTSLNAILEQFGIVPQDRTYRPHITVSAGRAIVYHGTIDAKGGYRMVRFRIDGVRLGPGRRRLYSAESVTLSRFSPNCRTLPRN